MKNLTLECPKSMLNMKGHPLLEYILYSLNAIGVTKCVISIGYKGDKISNYFGTTYKSVELEYVLNENIEMGDVYSLVCAKPMLEDKFFLVAADTIFEPEVAWRLYSLSKLKNGFCLAFVFSQTT